MQGTGLSLFGLVTLLAACGSSGESAAAGASALIGADATAPASLPFVVRLDGCTAAKIGPRTFLTAAHCFFEGPGDYEPYPEVILFPADPTADAAEWDVESVTLHPTWVASCHDVECTGNEVGTAKDSPGRVDAAVVTLKQLTPDIAVAPLDFEAIMPGDRVTLTGYGCTTAIGEGKDMGLFSAPVTVLDASALGHAGSLYASTIPQTAGSNFVTPATGWPTGGVGLCPGDSGGPVLREKSGVLEVVGINADYTFSGAYEAEGSTPVTNLHTRIDDASAQHVGAWIRGLLP